MDSQEGISKKLGSQSGRYRISSICSGNSSPRKCSASFGMNSPKTVRVKKRKIKNFRIECKNSRSFSEEGISPLFRSNMLSKEISPKNFRIRSNQAFKGYDLGQIGSNDARDQHESENEVSFISEEAEFELEGTQSLE